MTEEGFSSRLARLDDLIAEGRTSDALEALRQLEESADLPDDKKARAILRFQKARICLWKGDFVDAAAIADNVLREFRDIGDREWIALAHLLSSAIKIRLGSYKEAKVHAEAAVYQYTWEVKDDNSLGRAYDLMGVACKNLGAWSEAESNFRQALSVYDRAVGPLDMLRTSLNLAVLLRKLGKLEESMEVCKEALRIADEKGVKIYQCRFRLEIANISTIEREVEEAERYLAKACEIAEQCSFRREAVLVKETRGDVACLRGDFQAALHVFLEALKEARATAPGGDLEYEVLGRLARVYLAMGSAEKARQYAEAAIEYAAKCGDVYEHALGLRALGEIEIGEGRGGCGIDHLRQALSMLAEISAWSHETAVTEMTLGKALLDQRSETEALEHLLAARRIYSHLGITDAIREIDALVAGIVRPRYEGGIRRTIARRYEGSLDGCFRDVLQYGIVTADERIAGDVRQWGPTGVRVLIEGETGVGKELVARAMHMMSARREAPFVAVDCAGLSPSLVESELFGHTRGSFTGAVATRKGLIEEADGGTLFLDEVGELSEEMQVKFLRVLEEGCVRKVGSNKPTPVDCRIISATTKDLWAEVQAGRFRTDLYYRLKGVSMRIPSLRERPFDIPLLVEYFLGQFNDRYTRDVKFSDGAVERLVKHAWPGNVRELRNLVEALVASSRGNVVRESDVDRLLHVSGPGGIDRAILEATLKRSGGNKTQAAKLLGISRKTLWNKMKLFGIE